MLNAGVGVATSAKARARRYELQIPLRYRANGGGEWHSGTTKNISRSGVLFRGEDWAEPRTPLEITLTLPTEMGGERAAQVVCRGTVTRSDRSGNDSGGPLIAIRISHYRLVRP